MLQPSLVEVERLSREGAAVPVYLELLADMETPVSAYIKLGGGRGSFLLESVEGGERLGRYSFIGLEPDSALTLQDGVAELSDHVGTRRIPFEDPLKLIDDLLRTERVARVPDLPRFYGGAVGYLSYDLARSFENTPAPAGPGLGLPHGILGIHRTVFAFDHLRRTIKIITQVKAEGDVRKSYTEAAVRLRSLASRLRGGNGRPPTGPHPRTEESRVAACRAPGGAHFIGAGERSSDAPALASNFTQDRFEAAVRSVKEYIARGDAIQVVLSQRLSVPCAAPPLALYRALRSVNPSPYMYFLDYRDFQIVGSSPEMLVRVEESVVSVHPIAGTRRRGRGREEDEQLARELAADEKERAEHMMLVDLGRNDVGRVSEIGTVKLRQLLEIERYSHVMHLVSHVEGKLREGLRPVDALRAGFPAGTVSGAPKVRAMEIIAELEPDARGPYSGAVGYLGFDGTVDTAIAIRTAVLKEGIAHIQVGAGIVADSVPENEYQETLSKAEAMLRAVEAAESISADDESRALPVSSDRLGEEDDTADR